MTGLGEGDKEEITFTYTVTDDDGAESEERLVTVTVTGRNDAPVVSGPLITTREEGSSSIQVELLKGASDVDTGDTEALSIQDISFSVNGVPFGLKPPNGLSIEGSTLSIDPGHESFDELAVSEQRTIEINYLIEDRAGAGIRQTAEVVITGTNDKPVITDISNSEVIFWDQAVSGYKQDLFATGTLKVSDADLSDTQSLSATYRRSSLSLNIGGNAYDEDSAFDHESFTPEMMSALVNGLTFSEIDGGGNAQWTLSADDLDLDFLNENDELKLDYEVKARDVQGADSESQVITLLIKGLDNEDDRAIDARQTTRASTKAVSTHTSQSIHMRGRRWT